MNKLLGKSFLWMALGLLVTFITCLFVCHYPTILGNVYSGWNYIFFLIINFTLVVFLSFFLYKLTPLKARILFLIYSFVVGLTISSMFIYYNITSIILVFIITSFIYIVMAILGYKTKVNLVNWYHYFFATLIAALFVYFLNIFLDLSSVSLIISIILIIIFLGVTAIDVKRIKNKRVPYNINSQNLPLYFAFDLYLDYVNIFLNILNLFGDRN